MTLIGYNRNMGVELSLASYKDPESICHTGTSFVGYNIYFINVLKDCIYN